MIRGRTMFVAADKDGNRVLIEDAVKGTEYFCPVCGRGVIIKAKESLAVAQHFAHKKGECCPDKWHYDMSEWHRNWQNLFPKECRERVVEKNGVKHRADVLINGTVIEFQHSPISPQEIAERNKFYTESGCKVVWVFDANGKIQNEFGDTIDPMRCREGDLCWKRAKREFSIKMPENVTVYLEYKTTVSSKKHEGEEYSILLLTRKVEPKQIVFYKACGYLFWGNLLKEYGASSVDEFFSMKINSITEIKQITEARRFNQNKPKPINRQRISGIPGLGISRPNFSWLTSYAGNSYRGKRKPYRRKRGR